jgi:hypothetical protein
VPSTGQKAAVGAFTRQRVGAAAHPREEKADKDGAENIESGRRRKPYSRLNARTRQRAPIDDWRSDMGKRWRNRRTAAAIGVVVLAAGFVVASAVGAGARARHGHGPKRGGAPVLAVSLAPSMPTDPAIHGIAPGGLPWALGHGTVRLNADGRLRIDIHGLVIPIVHTVGGTTFPADTPRPVAAVQAELFCAPDGSGAVATTAAVPISERGDARIDARISLPATCLAPEVLVGPSGAAYIAAPGLR